MANDRDTSEEFKAGLKHVVAHSQSTPEDTRKCVDNVMNGTGSPSGSLGSLLSNAKASMLVSWFRDGSIQEFKNWAYVAARLEHIRNQMDKMDFRAYDLLAAILSDNEVMIKWYATEGFFLARRKRS